MTKVFCHHYNSPKIYLLINLRDHHNLNQHPNVATKNSLVIYCLQLFVCPQLGFLLRWIFQVLISNSIQEHSIKEKLFSNLNHICFIKFINTFSHFVIFSFNIFL